MNVLRVRNVHRALPLAVEMLRLTGVRVSSRNGDAFRCPTPVSTVYRKPLERVLYWPERDANPFFHFFESLWMLGGRSDVESVARYAKQVREYSDDGKGFHGVYGHRWRVGMPLNDMATYTPIGHNCDQLPRIADALRGNTTDRRQVLQIWNALSDLASPSKDVPCNLTATFQVSVEGALDLVVFNRSNDVVWGCYGANAVQFSLLLEYVARRAGLPVGTYTQVSVNWHGYDATFTPLLHRMQESGDGDLAPLIDAPSPYEEGTVAPYPLMDPTTEVDAWDVSLRQFLATNGRAPLGGRAWSDPFFPDVALPIVLAHDAYKDDKTEARYEASLKHLEKCRASDWRVACSEWITRRWRRMNHDGADGPAPQ